MTKFRVIVIAVLAVAPLVFLMGAGSYHLWHTGWIFTAWWPWVKGYEGELRAGAERPGPIYARIWLDQDLKKKMGH